MWFQARQIGTDHVVGSYDENGCWHRESKHDSVRAAEERSLGLNKRFRGGRPSRKEFVASSCEEFDMYRDGILRRGRE